MTRTNIFFHLEYVTTSTDCYTSLTIFIKGKTAARDIVQFVPYRDFIEKGNEIQIKSALASAVLEEIPDQVSQYMYDNNKHPKQGAPPSYY